jgi:hypothetical protein
MKLSRKQFEEAVWASDLNTNARFVLMMYASFNTYSDKAQEARPSKALVAKQTGIHPNTVGKYVEAAVEDGWLIPGSRYGRAQGYWLAEGSTHHQQLKPVVRGKNLHRPSTDDVEIDSNASTDGVSTNLLMVLNPSTDGVTLSTDDEELITKNNHIEEPKEEPKTVSKEPVVVADAPTSPLLLEQGDDSLNRELEELYETFDKDELERFRTLISFASWGKRMRQADAVRQVVKERSEEKW